MLKIIALTTLLGLAGCATRTVVVAPKVATSAHHAGHSAHYERHCHKHRCHKHKHGNKHHP